MYFYISLLVVLNFFFFVDQFRLTKINLDMHRHE